MKRFFTDIAKLQEAVKSRKLVIFAGAGISVDAGVPLWNDLIKQLAKEIDIPDHKNDHLRIAQMYYNERQSKEYLEKIREVLKYKRLRHNEIHEAILKLRPEHILTTNYDNLLEQAINAGAYPFSVVSKDNQFPYSRNVSLLVKIHGDLDDNNFVLKEDDYLEYANRYPLTEAFIKSIFTSKTVLFIGYSFSDPNLKMILQTVRNILGQHYQNAYLLSTDEQLHPAQREYLKQKGVVAINYTDADTEEKKYIDEYLKGENALKRKNKIEGQHLSSHGQKLLDFLRFIYVYDPFVEELSKENIVSQQYQSLKRFEELPVLPADFIANLYPFSISSQRVYSLENYVLKPANEKLANFYFQDIQEIESSEDKISVHKPDPESSTYEEEIYVIKELESASIRYIKKGGKCVRIQSGEHNQNCECFRCLFYTLRWSDLIKRIDQYEITETSLLADDMLAAYANYKLNNFKEAVYQYEKVALKAWQTNRTISYFIATQNIKRLRNLVYFFSDSERKEIVDKIDELNVEQVLHELQGIDEDQRELLKIIKDNKILHSVEQAINKALDETIRVRELYNSKGSYMGAKLYETVQVALEQLFVFFTGNHLVFDEYSEFKRVCRKGVEALIANHSIREGYQERLKKFDALFFTISLFYLSPKDLKDITKKYGISKLPAAPGDIQTLVAKVDNLLSPGKADLELSLEETNKALEVQFTKNWHLEHQFTDIFKNGFLLLSAVSLEEEDVARILKSAIHFLRVEKNTRGPRKAEHIGIFVMNQGKFVSYEQCIELLEVGVKKLQLFNNSNGLMQAVNHVINTHFSDQTIDDSLASSLLHLFEDRLHPSIRERFKNIGSAIKSSLRMK